jgi:hypothetical protein
MSGYTVKLRGAVGSAKLREFDCAEHGMFEERVVDPGESSPCPLCGAEAARVDSAPAVHTQFVVSATQGKSEPKPHRMSMDTRPLAEGQRFLDWKKDRKKLWEEKRKERVMELLKS